MQVTDERKAGEYLCDKFWIILIKRLFVSIPLPVLRFRAEGRYIAIRSLASDLPLTAYQNNSTMP